MTSGGLPRMSGASDANTTSEPSARSSGVVAWPVGGELPTVRDAWTTEPSARSATNTSSAGPPLDVPAPVKATRRPSSLSEGAWAPKAPSLG